MNVQKNARLTFIRRLERVQMITEGGRTPAEAASLIAFARISGSPTAKRACTAGSLRHIFTLSGNSTRFHAITTAQSAMGASRSAMRGVRRRITPIMPQVAPPARAIRRFFGNEAEKVAARPAHRRPRPCNRR